MQWMKMADDWVQGTAGLRSHPAGWVRGTEAGSRPPKSSWYTSPAFMNIYIHWCHPCSRKITDCEFIFHLQGLPFSLCLRILICVISLTVMAKWRGDKFIVFPGRGDKRPVGHFSSELTNHLREKHFSQNLLVQN